MQLVCFYKKSVLCVIISADLSAGAHRHARTREGKTRRKTVFFSVNALKLLPIVFKNRIILKCLVR